MQFAPTSSSQLSLMKRFFRDLTDAISVDDFVVLKQLPRAIIASFTGYDRNSRSHVGKA